MTTDEEYFAALDNRGVLADCCPSHPEYSGRCDARRLNRERIQAGKATTLLDGAKATPENQSRIEEHEGAARAVAYSLARGRPVETWFEFRGRREPDEFISEALYLLAVEVYGYDAPADANIKGILCHRIECGLKDFWRRDGKHHWGRTECQACGGLGVRELTVCPTCHGKGDVSRRRTDLIDEYSAKPEDAERGEYPLRERGRNCEQELMLGISPRRGALPYPGSAPSIGKS